MRLSIRSLLAPAAALLACAAFAQAPVNLERIRLPPGFTIEVWARVDNARQMALGRHDASSGGTVYVGSMRAGQVNAIPYDAAFKARAPTRIADGLQMPTGVAYRDGSLFVAAVGRILRYDGVDRGSQGAAPPAVVVTDTLPTETHHGWKFIGFGPDGKLYVPVGAPCNVCEPGARHGRILRMNADGGGMETFASGVRNSVGFDWQPQTRDLWFTENGRDMLGDNLPPDELNHAPRAGMHFGFPYCHGGDIADPDFGKQRACTEFTAPARKLGPHVASLGMRFYTGTMFPAAYRDQIFIAEHGSWNRAERIGYRISLVRLHAGKAVAYEPFATGWLQGDSVSGRPSDVLVLPDGSLLVADDLAGAIYRIRYSGGS